jgi:hypothetical protein
MQAMGDTLLLHWQPVASNDAPQTLELRVPDYVAESPSKWQLIPFPYHCIRCYGCHSYASDGGQRYRLSLKAYSRGQHLS